MTRKKQELAPEHLAQLRRSAAQKLDKRDGMLSSDELAAFFGVPMGTLDQWASRGGGPDFRLIGKFRRYAPVDVHEWMKVNPPVPTSASSRSTTRGGAAA